MKNKKALTQTTLVVLIIALVVGFILFSFMNILSTGLSRQGNKEACKLSVLKKAELKKIPLTGNIESDSNLACSVNYIDIKKEGIYLSYDDKENIKEINFKGKKENEKEESIKKYLANKLADCWYQFGEGKIDFLGNIDAGIFGNTGVRCFPCTYIRFEENFLDITYKEWEEYLSKENINLKKISYKDYLSKGQETYSKKYKKELMNTNKGGQLAIYFIAYKSASDKKKGIESAISFLLPSVPVPFVDIDFKKDVLISLVNIYNSEDLAGKCDRLY